MTTVKPSFKPIALLLALLLLVLSLSACQTQSTELPFELLNPQPSVSEEPLSLYRIVLPATCSAELFQAATELGVRLTEQTGVPYELVYDTETVGAENCAVILLGNCDRTVCRRMLSDLRSNDYLCRTDGNTVVLGGVTEQATLAALEQYYEELFVYATAQSLLPSSAEFSFRDEYPIEAITLNGFELFEYTVVYDTQELTELAKQFQASLCTEGGYALPCQTAEDFKGETKQIYLTLDQSKADDAFSLLPNEYGMTLCASNLFGLSVGLKHLQDKLLTPTDHQRVDASVKHATNVSYAYTAQGIAILGLKQLSSDLSELTALNQQLNQDAPNLVFLGEIAENCLNAVEKTLSFRYTSEENSDLFTFGTDCRLLADLSDQTEGSAKLYSVGAGDEMFWLLRLDTVPSIDFSELLSDRDCPLLILLETELSAPLSKPPHITDDRFEVIADENDGARLFAVYAEEDCFELIRTIAVQDYCSVTVHRGSAFYTKHP